MNGYKVGDKVVIYDAPGLMRRLTGVTGDIRDENAVTETQIKAILEGRVPQGTQVRTLLLTSIIYIAMHMYHMRNINERSI